MTRAEALWFVLVVTLGTLLSPALLSGVSWLIAVYAAALGAI